MRLTVKSLEKRFEKLNVKIKKVKSSCGDYSAYFGSEFVDVFFSLRDLEEFLHFMEENLHFMKENLAIKI